MAIKVSAEAVAYAPRLTIGPILHEEARDYKPLKLRSNSISILPYQLIDGRRIKPVWIMSEHCRMRD